MGRTPPGGGWSLVFEAQWQSTRRLVSELVAAAVRMELTSRAVVQRLPDLDMTLLPSLPRDFPTARIVRWKDPK